MQNKIIKMSVPAVAVIVIAIAALLGGCSGGGNVKTGLGHVISIDKSADATSEGDGVAQVDTVMAAVTVDGNGKILSVTIDTAQVRVPFSKEGVITADRNAELKTKVELGDDYGMIVRSGIGKEWYEQIADLEKWMVGKTIDQVKAMKTTQSDGSIKTAEPDLTSKVTIDISDYLAAVEEAVKNAR
jgi:hypothetical protein